MPTVVPHLTSSDANKAVEFYKAAFGAKNSAGTRRPTARSSGSSSLTLTVGLFT